MAELARSASVGGLNRAAEVLQLSPPMSATRIIGAILIVIGLIGLLWGGVFWTREKTVFEVGPVEAKTQERDGVPISPIVGGVILAAGVALLLVPTRRRA
jgi:hypothetical protein